MHARLLHVCRVQFRALGRRAGLDAIELARRAVDDEGLVVRQPLQNGAVGGHRQEELGALRGQVKDNLETGFVIGGGQEVDGFLVGEQERVTTGAKLVQIIAKELPHEVSRDHLFVIRVRAGGAGEDHVRLVDHEQVTQDALSLRGGLADHLEDREGDEFHEELGGSHEVEEDVAPLEPLPKPPEMVRAVETGHRAKLGRVEARDAVVDHAHDVGLGVRRVRVGPLEGPQLPDEVVKVHRYLAGPGFLSLGGIPPRERALDHLRQGALEAEGGGQVIGESLARRHVFRPPDEPRDAKVRVIPPEDPCERELALLPGLPHVEDQDAHLGAFFYHLADHVRKAGGLAGPAGAQDDPARGQVVDCHAPEVTGRGAVHEGVPQDDVIGVVLPEALPRVEVLADEQESPRELEVVREVKAAPRRGDGLPPVEVALEDVVVRAPGGHPPRGILPLGVGNPDPQGGQAPEEIINGSRPLLLGSHVDAGHEKVPGHFHATEAPGQRAKPMLELLGDPPPRQVLLGLGCLPPRRAVPQDGAIEAIWDVPADVHELFEEGNPFLVRRGGQ